MLLLEKDLAFKKDAEEMRWTDTGRCLLSTGQEIMNRKQSAELQ